MSLFDTGVRPAIDAHMLKLAAQKRDYGDYWSASSAGYCMRLVIMRRMGVPQVPELQESLARTTRVFESGHVFHEWIQRVTKEAGISIAQETELQDEDLMIRGHFDDLILVDGEPILYDYKTQNSMAFTWEQKRKAGMSHYHKMQLGTYMYMMRNSPYFQEKDLTPDKARILKISKDDLRMSEKELLWTPDLEKEVVEYWRTLNGYWKRQVLPRCTCLEHEGGFMGKRSSKGKVYNDFFYNDEPCSEEWYKKFKEAKDANI